MKRRKSDGYRLWSFRGGDRSEYLALYGLSRFSFVYPFPRQEDFGVVDLLCILTKVEEDKIYPETAFYVQVKSNGRPFTFRQAMIQWMARHMDHPLFVCVADKNKDMLSLYALTPVVEVLFLRPEASEIKISMTGDEPSDAQKAVEKAAGARIDVVTGPPVLQKTLAELEADRGEIYSIIEPWIRNGADNAARRRVGRIATTRFRRWQTNVPVSFDQRLGLYYFSTNYAPAEKELALLLTALAHSYRHAKQAAKLDALAGLLGHLRPYLDPHGLAFADRKMVVDEPADGG
jgi:hypothetical protein